ncbi:M1 family aminopeptidase [Wenyingzhuangia sp. 2_MG-2023]|uniref:M1 family metallopeptidase n=1 Tax=Wenyingzhuangia sp. 2_MG-2023 TaxID=3062639 RepID=UPI0026E22514|nr:M1 family aminopeptidase [Wenyingzhuangia sp. 2_MG-2023]MDO6738483.1 M1 family aminopeptidase [Wenyingzhuangia sp. 2_MG-2023]
MPFLLFVSCNKQVNHEFPLKKGVSKKLADYRKTQVSNVKYHLFFNLPKTKEDPIDSKLILDLAIHDLNQPLYLDFKSNHETPKSAIVNGQMVPIQYQNEHLIISDKNLVLGKNNIEIEFIAGDAALNRNTDYLFTLFVPARARTAFPCFDQPNIKANYSLSMSVPKDWTVLCGSKLKSTQNKGDFIAYKYQESDKMSTYLFSFVAGKYDIINSADTKFNMSLYHQEKDSTKIQLSSSKIFQLHQQSNNFLENYTKYPFSFQKLDYAAIYSHPYGGMEHTGAIQYRQSQLFLDTSATLNQKLRRAKLIAHETAHMWFGNLVTMKWFNDVWLKEVFANFMADKIVNPQFESINHELSFFIDHYPAAFKVDRTKGANPIRQSLDNLNNAGSLYGNIIYHKAPIMMRQLETLIGKDQFQKGIIEYIKTYQNNNADWNDLIHILDKNTDLDLKEWSQVWVHSPGRPIIESNITYDDVNNITSFFIEQQSEDTSDKIWPQVFEIALMYPDRIQVLKVDLKNKKNRLIAAEGLAKPNFIVYNSNGLGYGVFPTTNIELDLVPNIKNEISRAAIYVNYYENALNGNIPMEKAMDLFQEGLKEEKNELILSLLSHQIAHVFWTYLDEDKRVERQHKIEETLFTRLQLDEEPSIKKTLFNSFLSFAYTGTAREELYNIWHKELEIPNLILNQDDFVNIAMHLALYQHEKASVILTEAKTDIKDPNKIKRFDFLMPALSQDPKIRNDFFKSFANQEHREKENWVLTACYYIHHPLRQKTAIESLELSLALLDEIQKTGDIFFPKGWLSNTIGRYSSYEAFVMVTEFLQANPNLNPQLRLKLLQATDDLFRIHQSLE